MKQVKEITSDQVLGLSANLFLMPLDLKKLNWNANKLIQSLVHLNNCWFEGSR